MNNAFVCLMGMGTVFIGLICIIAICLIMSLIFKNAAKTEEKSTPAAVPASVPAAAPVAVENTLSAQEKQKIIAATCAVIAEELGTDVSNIRVLSFKRI